MELKKHVDYFIYGIAVSVGLILIGLFLDGITFNHIPVSGYLMTVLTASPVGAFLFIIAESIFIGEICGAVLQAFEDEDERIRAEYESSQQESREREVSQKQAQDDIADLKRKANSAITQCGQNKENGDKINISARRYGDNLQKNLSATLAEGRAALRKLEDITETLK